MQSVIGPSCHHGGNHLHVTYSSLTGEGGAASEADPTRDPTHLTPTPFSSSAPSSYTSPLSSLTPRLPHPRRPPHPLPPRLYIQPPAAELGPPHTQVNSHTNWTASGVVLSRTNLNSVQTFRLLQTSCFGVIAVL